jgi:hypothetical protein
MAESSIAAAALAHSTAHDRRRVQRTAIETRRREAPKGK